MTPPERGKSGNRPVIDPGRSMKPLLGQLVQEAVHLALIDSAVPPGGRLWTDAEVAEMQLDIFAIPTEALGNMDPLALAQNVAVRLLGSGGWFIGGEYAGNATARDLFDVTFHRPDQSHVSELAFDVLRAMEDAQTLKCAHCDVPMWDGDEYHDCPHDAEAES